MNKSCKNAVSAAISAAMVLSSIVLPLSAAADYAPMVEGDTVLNEWKFDFGTEDNVMDGYTAVTTDRDVISTGDYGFLGIDENGYKVSARIDGFAQQEGQVIELSVGGSGDNDAIGSTGEDTSGNAGDEYYPTRFAMKVDDGTYYRVRATVTTLDPEQDASITLYTERKHPIYTDKTVSAGDVYTVDFTVDVEPIYYEKSDPKGLIEDGYLTVSVLGENSALASLEIQQVETVTTLWVLGDSTVTDGEGTLPFFRLQNYTGVGTGLHKYVPSTVAVVNEGEGGLNAADNNHFNVVKERIKAGDYMYVEYGHNHKSDGAAGYLTYLDKYYEACQAVGAYLILVGPMDRHQSSQYDSSTNTWTSTLSDFSDTAKAYVEEKVAAGATDIAFVDLNQPSLDWYTEVTGAAGNSWAALNYYFQTPRSGSTDETHPNDAGADQLAYCFFEEAAKNTDTAQAAVLAGLLENRTDNVPSPVGEEITSLGAAPNSAWPYYQQLVEYDYPASIKKIYFDGTDGELSSIDVEKLTNEATQVNMSNYGRAIVAVYNEDGTLANVAFANLQLDNSTANGTQNLTFDEGNGVTLGENQYCKAYVWEFLDSSADNYPITMVPYAYSYQPGNVDHYLITGEDGEDVDSFDYYGISDGDSVAGYNNWTIVGSAVCEVTKATDGDVSAARLYSSGTKEAGGNGSFYVMRQLDETVSGGRIQVTMDVKYVTGTMTFALTEKTTNPANGYTGITAFSITDGIVTGSDGSQVGEVNAGSWASITYTIDMDYGIQTIAVNGGAEVTLDASAYQTNVVTDPSPDPVGTLLFTSPSGTGGEMYISNVSAALLTQQTLPEITIAAVSADETMGAAYIGEAGTTETTVTMNDSVTVNAEAESGYEFVNWTDESGNVIAYSSEYTLRAHDAVTLTANFQEEVIDPITYEYNEKFNELSTATLANNGWVSPNAQDSATIESDTTHGNYLQFAPGSANDRNLKGTFPMNSVLSVPYVMEFDLAITPGNNHATDFTVYDTSATISANTQLESNYILKLYNNEAYSTTWTINGGSNTVTLPSGSWVHVYMYVNPDEGTVELTITDSSDAQLYTGVESVNGTGIVCGINAMGGRYQSVTLLDNIKIYTADQID